MVECNAAHSVRSILLSHILTGEQLGFYGRRTRYHTDAADRNPFEVVIELTGIVVF
jgi:hypothetical protein